MDKIAKIASRFVNLVKRSDWGKLWAEKEIMSEADIRVLFGIVAAAGFEPKKVVFGKLRGNYLDEERRATGKTYPINDICPYKVIGQYDGADYRATGWLDTMVCFVIRGSERPQLTKEVRQEIERSVPLKPIQLTPEGDMLEEDSPSGDSGYLVDHTRDNHKLISCVGLHSYCNGWVDRCDATKMHDALLCRKCHLRVLFPKNTKTYGELRQIMAAKIGYTK